MNQTANNQDLKEIEKATSRVLRALPTKEKLPTKEEYKEFGFSDETYEQFVKRTLDAETENSLKHKEEMNCFYCGKTVHLVGYHMEGDAFYCKNCKRYYSVSELDKEGIKDVEENLK